MEDNKPPRKDEPSAARNKLQKLSGDSIATQKTIAVQIRLTALNSKSESDAQLAQEFLRCFWAEPPEAVEWAFRAWRDESPYFPAILDIRKLIASWHRQQREQADATARRQEKAQIEELRERGELVEFADIVKRMRETLNSQPEPEHLRREREFRHRMQRK